MNNEKSFLVLLVMFVWVVVFVVDRNRATLGVDLVFYIGFPMDIGK